MKYKVFFKITGFYNIEANSEEEAEKIGIGKMETGELRLLENYW